MDNLWMLAGHTCQDYPFILVGYSLEQQLYHQIFDIGLAMSSLVIPDACHPVKLDYLLASALQPLANLCVVAGCTIRALNVPAFSGGVLGDPGSSPSSAGGLVENLSGAWSLVTFPQSPGMAQNVKISSLPSAVQALCTERVPDDYTLKQLSVYTQSIGADKFMAITDGSGPGAYGAALIRKKSKVVLWRLEEVDK